MTCQASGRQPLAQGGRGALRRAHQRERRAETLLRSAALRRRPCAGCVREACDDRTPGHQHALDALGRLLQAGGALVGVALLACRAHAPAARWLRRVRDSGRARTGCRRRGSAARRRCGGCAPCRCPAAASSVGTALSETTQTSAARAPSPIETARASSCSAIRQKPPGMMVQPSGVAAANTRSTNGRGTMWPWSHTGVVESRTSSWPTKSMPRSLMAAISRSAFGLRQLAGEHRAVALEARNAAAIGAFDRELVEPRQHLVARGLLAAPPGRDVRHHQSLRRADAGRGSAGSPAAPAPPARPSPACWRRRRRPCAATSISPGTPRCEEASSSSGSSEVGIDAAQQHVEPLQPCDGADMDAVVANGEIVALDQQEAEIARQRRVLEIGLAEGARASAAPIRGSSRSAERAQAVAKRLEERRDALDIHRLVEIGEGARQHQAVLQRIARARKAPACGRRAPTSGRPARGRHRRHRS